MKKKLITILTIILAAAVFSGCGIFSGDKLNKYSVQYYDLFDTVVSVTAYCKDQESFDELSASVYEVLLRYHRLSDIYNDYEGVTNIRTLNDKAAEGPVEVPAELAAMLAFASAMCRATDGNVNVAMGAVLSLWHDARETAMEDPSKAYLPSAEQLREAAKHCDIDDLKIDMDKNTVYYADPELKLDAGAIAKGYAVEMAAQMLEAAGTGGVIISAGGNVRTVGDKPEGGWKVAVQDPEEPDKYAAVVENVHGAVVTSGAYQRYFEYKGRRYHHIIDKDSLMPEDRYLSVTIREPDSGRADALSTALFNMDLEEGQAFIEAMDGAEALWILPDRTMVQSAGW